MFKNKQTKIKQNKNLSSVSFIELLTDVLVTI